MEFAEERVKAGKESAIARTGEVRIGEGTPLEERAIYSTDKTDFVGMTILRTKDAKAANDEVRELFRKSIAEMFGGEGNIPDSVKDAMLLKDYGSGKPLTARRILEVNNAIESLHRVNVFGSETDPEGGLAQIALNAGYSRLDFGKLNTAANFLMQNEGMTAEQALAELVTKGSAANRAMEVGRRYMKSNVSFSLGYHRMQLVKGYADSALQTIAANGSKENVAKLSDVAFNIVLFMEEVGIAIEDHREITDVPKSEFSNLQSHLKGFCEKMLRLQADIQQGRITDRKAIYEKLFGHQEHKYFTNILGEVVNKLKKIENRTSATDDFIRQLEMFPGKVREMQTKLSDACANAFAQNMLESAKGKLVAAANEGGMATGTSSELPAVMLDKLGEFLAEDPYGNIEKVDKFCTYLENNGPAALHVADGKNVDLNWLYREVIG